MPGPAHSAPLSPSDPDAITGEPRCVLLRVWSTDIPHQLVGCFAVAFDPGDEERAIKTVMEWHRNPEIGLPKPQALWMIREILEVS